MSNLKFTEKELVKDIQEYEELHWMKEKRLNAPAGTFAALFSFPKFSLVREKLIRTRAAALGRPHNNHYTTSASN